MVDPVSGAVVSAIAKGAVDQAWESIITSDDPEETWLGSAETCVVQARSSITHYDIKLGSSYDQMRVDIENIGDSAQQLAERGRIKGFNKNMVDLLESLARACLEYANYPSHSNYIPEKQFASKLDQIGGEIITITQNA